MHQQERPTLINDLATVLNNKLTPITGDTQAVSAIIDRITNGQHAIKPYNPPAFCMYPESPRRDELSFTKGLGQVNLQPVIDQLNAFKQAAIKAIKAQFNAMGPENVKDSKLSAGALEMLNEIYEAAKCFTSMVANVNNLVTTYVQAITQMIVDVVNMINKIENDIFKIINMLKGWKAEFETLLMTEIFDLINAWTGIGDLLNIINKIEAQLLAASAQVNTLLKSPERSLLQIEMAMTLLKNKLNFSNFLNSLLDSLNKSKTNAIACTMTDNFLDDIDLSPINASSYNWSITNTAGLYDYNSYDTLSIIPKLNALFKNFSIDNPSNPLIIAAVTESGYIVVPDAEQGLISAGLDPVLGTGVGMILELSINNGDTIIRAIARGDQPDTVNGDTYVKRNFGEYYSKGIEQLEYNKIILNTTNTWDLYLVNTNLLPAIGSYYYFNDPMTQQPWTFSWVQTNIPNTTDPTIIPQVTDNGVVYEFPVLYKVINVTHNCVTVQRQMPSDLNVADFITSPTVGATYMATDNSASIPGDLTNANGDYVICAKLTGSGTDYIVATTDTDGNQSPVPNGSYSMTVNDIPGATNPVSDTAAITWSYGIYTILQNTLYTITLNQYILPAGSDADIPHVGDQIPCLNWSLSVYPVGNENAIKNVQFSRTFPGPDISMFFLKAHWGFIPQSMDVISQVAAQNATTVKNVNNNLFGSQ